MGPCLLHFQWGTVGTKQPQKCAAIAKGTPDENNQDRDDGIGKDTDEDENGSDDAEDDLH